MRDAGLELNWIHCMDCLEGMRRLEDGTVEVIVTSPPYNIGVSFSHCIDEIPFRIYFESWRKNLAIILARSQRSRPSMYWIAL